MISDVGIKLYQGDMVSDADIRLYQEGMISDVGIRLYQGDMVSDAGIRAISRGYGVRFNACTVCKQRKRLKTWTRTFSSQLIYTYIPMN